MSRDRLPGPLASYGERVVAFSLDYALFALGFSLSLKAFFPQYPVLINPNGMVWAWGWMALFVVYQAYASSDGRSSFGKKIMGLRVVDEDGDPLTLPLALVRALGYFPSSFLGLGFLWPLASRSRQGWHDFLAGSTVISKRRQHAQRAAWARVPALACLAVFAGVWAWEFLFAAHYYRLKTLAHAGSSLEGLGRLQELHLAKKGRYADNLVALAVLSGDPGGFLKDMADLFDPEQGVRISLTPKGYTIRARGRDAQSTPLVFSGPA